MAQYKAKTDVNCGKYQEGQVYDLEPSFGDSRPDLFEPIVAVEAEVEKPIVAPSKPKGKKK